MIADTIISIGAISIASAGIGAILQYTRDQWRIDHPRHPHDRH